MSIQRKQRLNQYQKVISLTGIVLSILLGMSNCAKDFPSLIGVPAAQPQPTKPTASTCACSTTPVECPCVTPGSSTTVSSTTGSANQPTSPVPPVQVDTLSVPPPHFSPDGGNFYMSTAVQLTADTLPPQGVIEYSVNAGQTWQTNRQFTVTTGGTVLARIRAGTKLSRSSSASYSLYFKRMFIIGNSIMSHGPAPDLGWYNFNGMAASAPEKDFVHLLTGQLQALYPSLTVKLQSGGNFETKFGTSGYSIDEFNQPLQEFKPDLIIIRIGENMDDSQVANRNLEGNLRQLLDRLTSYSQPVRIVCTTSVWYKPNADDVIRKVTAEKGHTLVDLNYIVWQKQCFASQYQNPGVAAHPNDMGMKLISDMIWEKIQ